MLVVLPTFNEEASVGRVIREVRAAAPAATVLVVDDGSKDRSREVALDCGALVLSLPYNLGVGGAMRAGFKYGLRAGFTAAVQIDADGQHDPCAIPALLEQLAAGADVVVGARFAGAGQYGVRGPRRWAMRVLAVSISRLAGHRMTDVTSGFRMCNRRAMALFAQHYPVEYLGDTVESLVIASRAGMRVTQVPVEMRQRQDGRASQSAVKASLYLIRAVLAMGITLVREQPELPRPTRADAEEPA